MYEQELTDLYIEKLPVYQGWAVNKTRDPALAEDLVHSAFTKAWEKREQFDGRNIGGWVFRILSNGLFDHIRHYHRESLTPEGEIYDAIEPSTTDEYTGAFDEIGKLKEDYQEALVLKALGFNGKQLSEYWGVGKVTANARVMRARQAAGRLSLQ